MPARVTREAICLQAVAMELSTVASSPSKVPFISSCEQHSHDVGVVWACYNTFPQRLENARGYVASRIMDQWSPSTAMSSRCRARIGFLGELMQLPSPQSLQPVQQLSTLGEVAALGNACHQFHTDLQYKDIFHDFRL